MAFEESRKFFSLLKRKISSSRRHVEENFFGSLEIVRRIFSVFEGGFCGFYDGIFAFAFAVADNRARILDGVGNYFNVDIRLSFQRHGLGKIFNDFAGVELEIFTRQLNQRVEDNFVLGVLEISSGNEDHGHADFLRAVSGKRDEFDIFPDLVRRAVLR